MPTAHNILLTCIWILMEIWERNCGTEAHWSIKLELMTSASVLAFNQLKQSGQCKLTFNCSTSEAVRAVDCFKIGNLMIWLYWNLVLLFYIRSFSLRPFEITISSPFSIAIWILNWIPYPSKFLYNFSNEAANAFLVIWFKQFYLIL